MEEESKVDVQQVSTRKRKVYQTFTDKSAAAKVDRLIRVRKKARTNIRLGTKREGFEIEKEAFEAFLKRLVKPECPGSLKYLTQLQETSVEDWVQQFRDYIYPLLKVRTWVMENAVISLILKACDMKKAQLYYNDVDYSDGTRDKKKDAERNLRTFLAFLRRVSTSASELL